MRLARDPVDVRLAWLLVYLSRFGGAVEQDGSLGLPVNLSREDLALWIGAARRSVGAALQDWRSRGVTASRHGKLVIPDLGFLITKADIPRDRRAADGVGVTVNPGPAPNPHAAAVERPTAATRARPPQGPGIMPTRAAGPAVAALAPACRARQFPPRAAVVPRGAGASHGSSYRREVPSGLAASSAAAVGMPTHPEAPCRGPARPWQATNPSGASAHPTYSSCEYRLPAGLTECDGIGIGLRTRSACPTVKV
jgi:Crp-like helix-turn-helix domain